MSNILFRTYDPRGIEIILHRSRYQNHIQLQHGIDDDSIRETIEMPNLITVDRHDEFKENYYADNLSPDLPDRLLKVCVLFKNNIGRVITAFDIDMLHPDETIIWQE
ncbi:hypothetical protein KFU94_20585 [Chloroflexi bacterium TSY]|nr:hypothetical protein [Chloroflexi bacterium TSY]